MLSQVTLAVVQAVVVNYEMVGGVYTIKCRVFPENFCERKQAKTGIDINEQTW